MTQTPESKQLKAKLTEMETQARRFASLFANESKKLKVLMIKFKDLVRENQRLKQELAKMGKDLKQAQEKAIWSHTD